MKHSIRFIQFNFFPSGKGKSVFILRGMEIRKYPYNADKAHYLNMLTIDDSCWEPKFYTDRIEVSRIYPE